MGNLTQRSIDIIRSNQTSNGAYIASPNFPSYRYCWFRDGAYTAYAMDLYDQADSSARFHEWVAQAILQREELVRKTVVLGQQKQPLSPEDILHTRYTLDGLEGTREEWPNFQLDGFGTWLWALEQHVCGFKHPLPDHWLKAAQLVGDYLTALWLYPCYDCWEEHPDKIHTHTLAAIYGGLHSLSRLDGQDRVGTLQSIRKYIFQNQVYDGYFVKFSGSYTVDASLLGLAIPYQITDVRDPFFIKTLERIENSLMHGGGVHRFPTDTYYGGGEWLLLTAWYGWVNTQVGNPKQAASALAWIENHADGEGNLPEQVPASLIDPNYYEPWQRRWGQIATPLLWSHANYLILRKFTNPSAAR